MGTRLYAQASVTNALYIVGADAEDYVLWQKIQEVQSLTYSTHANRAKSVEDQSDEPGCLIYNLIASYPGVQAIDAFKSYGFGRYVLCPAGEYTGSIDEPVSMAEALQAQAIAYPEFAPMVERAIALAQSGKITLYFG
jgi:hypothetical protein